MYLKLNQRLEIRKIVDKINFWVEIQNKACEEKEENPQKISYYRFNVMEYQDQLISYYKKAISELKIKE